MATLFRCANCGSDKVLGVAWVYLNGGTVTEHEPPEDLYGCDACDATPDAVCLVDTETGYCWHGDHNEPELGEESCPGRIEALHILEERKKREGA